MDMLPGFFGRTNVDLPITLFRLGLSFLLGGCIGLERGWHRQSAGLRTHILICLGSTLLTLLSIYIPQQYTHFEGSDPTRIAAQVIAGIGFLGGGAIFRFGTNVRGLTTAASIWVVAGIGMAVGAGMYLSAFVVTGLVLIALFFLASVEKRLFPGRPLRNLEIILNDTQIRTDAILPILKSYRLDIRTLDVSQSYGEGLVRLKLTVQVPEGIDWSGFYKSLGGVQGISKVTLDQKL